jgi:release factor glutamine methyltransferase
MPTLREHLHQAAAALEAAGVAGARREAEALLARLLGRERAWLYAHPEDGLTAEDAARWREWIARRAAGEPPQYIAGTAEFCGRAFAVTPAVLIPRPETELLVEAVLEREPAADAARIVDVGTGSGCIAITLALARPRARLIGVDRSAAALAVARENAERLGARVEWVESDLLAAVAGPFDVIVSNPPYVAEGELAGLAREVREHEPRAALIAGPRGDEVYRRLIPQAAERLRAGGWLALELGYQPAASVRALLAGGDWHEVEVRRDAQGWERVGLARRAARKG